MSCPEPEYEKRYAVSHLEPTFTDTLRQICILLWFVPKIYLADMFAVRSFVRRQAVQLAH